MRTGVVVAQLLATLGAAVSVAVGSVVRKDIVSSVKPDGDSGSGYRALPTVPGATIQQLPVGGKNATITHYETDASAYVPERILRAVIMVAGIDRVAWNEWIYLNASLLRAAQGGVVDPSTVILSAPEFFTVVDAGAYPVDAADGKTPTSSALVWMDKDWGAGNDAVFPDKALMAGLPYGTPLNGSASASSRRGSRGRRHGHAGAKMSAAEVRPSVEDGPGVGSFDALDALLSSYLNRTRFPNLTRVVLAGFSLGGQLVSRYAALRPLDEEDARVTYWVASPGSFLYLNETRPDRIGKSCRGTYNNYKYGLGGTAFPGYLHRISQDHPTASTLATRLSTRTTRYLVGLLDTLAGDASCEANAQGPSHVLKMLNWALRVLPYYISSLSLGSSSSSNATLSGASQTRLSLVRNTGHDDGRLIQSDPGVVTLFCEDYPSAGQNATAPASNGDGEGVPSEAASGARRRAEGGLVGLGRRWVAVVPALMGAALALS